MKVSLFTLVALSFFSSTLHSRPTQFSALLGKTFVCSDYNAIFTADVVFPRRFGETTEAVVIPNADLSDLHKLKCNFVHRPVKNEWIYCTNGTTFDISIFYPDKNSSRIFATISALDSSSSSDIEDVECEIGKRQELWD